MRLVLSISGERKELQSVRISCLRLRAGVRVGEKEELVRVARGIVKSGGSG